MSWQRVVITYVLMLFRMMMSKVETVHFEWLAWSLGCERT